MPTMHDIRRALGIGGRRRKRMARFKELFPQRFDLILDCGGTRQFWDLYGNVDARKIVVLSPFMPNNSATEGTALRFVVADGRRLPFRDRTFDLVFSNSVIEHVVDHAHDKPNQERFALELRRSGRNLYCETPNQRFVVEPHFIAPFIHWLPVPWRKKVARHFTVWGLTRKPKRSDVEAMVEGIRMLTPREFVAMFPDCEFIRERYLGMTKALIAVRRADG